MWSCQWEDDILSVLTLLKHGVSVSAWSFTVFCCEGETFPSASCGSQLQVSLVGGPSAAGLLQKATITAITIIRREQEAERLRKKNRIREQNKPAGKTPLSYRVCVSEKQNAALPLSSGKNTQSVLNCIKLLQFSLFYCKKVSELSHKGPIFSMCFKRWGTDNLTLYHISAPHQEIAD